MCVCLRARAQDSDKKCSSALPSHHIWPPSLPRCTLSTHTENRNFSPLGTWEHNSRWSPLAVFPRVYFPLLHMEPVLPPCSQLLSRTPTQTPTSHPQSLPSSLRPPPDLSVQSPAWPPSGVAKAAAKVHPSGPAQPPPPPPLPLAPHWASTVRGSPFSVIATEQRK